MNIIKKKNSQFYYRTHSGNFWHMPVVKSKECIFHEIYSGPWKKEYDVKFPNWAPDPKDKESVNLFMKNFK